MFNAAKQPIDGALMDRKDNALTGMCQSEYG